MTIQEKTDLNAMAFEGMLERLEAGDGGPAASWLADRLNEIDAAIVRTLDGASRAARSDDIDRYVEMVSGDRRDVDEILLGDGSRVIWQLGTSRSTTKWVAESGSPGDA